MKDIKNYLINESNNISHSEWEDISTGEFRANDGSILVYLTEALTLPFIKNYKNCLEITLLNAVKKREGTGSSLVKEIIKYEEQIKALLNLDEPNRELIKTLVKRIYIDKDKNIEIQYRFKVLYNIKINYKEIS